MLVEALRRETALIQYYEQLLAECDYPDVNKFVNELAEERRAAISQIVDKLNQIQARASTLDGIMSSFDSG